MKHLRHLSFLLSLILPLAIWAGPRTFKQAQAIAERQAAQLGVNISQQARARSFGNAPSTVSDDALTSSGAAAYYVFPYGENNGYAIVSGDDQMPELVAYSDQGTLDETNMSDGCRDFLKAYKAVAEAVAKGDAEALKLMAQKRGLLASAEYQQPKVEPLLGEIAWDQREPYYNMCPVSNGQNCLTGCVATTMAQIMRYWKYPESLVNDIPATSYTPKLNKGEKYDWENMIPVYEWYSDPVNYNSDQADAVAKLMMHCGAAVRMSYSTSASSASLTPEIFSTYFGYDPDMLRLVYRAAFSLSEWCKLIDGELSAKRPIPYCGQSYYMGHQFICDGADGKGLYHINWGWGGTNNGYFDISILNPYVHNENSGQAKAGFNRDAMMIIGLQPDNGVKDDPLIQGYAMQAYSLHYRSTKAERSSVSENFKISVYNKFANMGPDDFDGMIAVGIK